MCVCVHTKVCVCSDILMQELLFKNVSVKQNSDTDINLVESSITGELVNPLKSLLFTITLHFSATT